jgi:hypothetical protein
VVKRQGVQQQQAQQDRDGMSYVKRAIQIVSQAFSPGASPTLAATPLPRLSRRQRAMEQYRTGLWDTMKFTVCP